MRLRRQLQRSALGATVLCGLVACERRDPPPPAAAPIPSAVSSNQSPETPGVSATPPRSACPEDMVLVDGRLCPVAEQICDEHHPEYVSDHAKSERCLRYREPSRCLSRTRRLLRVCIDRYEWPNRRGAMPRVLTSWGEAKALCESTNKRLCDEDEWLLACEGESALPYVYGYVRDPTRCVIDRVYVPGARPLKRWEACKGDAQCRERFERLDQREPAGSFPQCVSSFGAFDLNGNVNEWVNIPGEHFPERSGLKGGWWGPVRNRCRPTVRFHKEEDFGYEVGFRCCRDAAP